MVENLDFDGDTDWVSLLNLTSLTSRELREKTGAFLERVKRGQRFRVLRSGEVDAVLVPASDQVDPLWDEVIVKHAR